MTKAIIEEMILCIVVPFCVLFAVRLKRSGVTVVLWSALALRFTFPIIALCSRFSVIRPFGHTVIVRISLGISVWVS